MAAFGQQQLGYIGLGHISSNYFPGQPIPGYVGPGGTSASPGTNPGAANIGHGAPAGTGGGSAGSSAGANAPSAPYSGIIRQYLNDANTGGFLYLDYGVTGGEIVEDIRQDVYSNARVELGGLTQYSYNSLNSLGGATGGVLGLSFSITEVLESLGGGSHSSNLGIFAMDRVEQGAEPGRFSAVFFGVGEAQSTMGPPVSGDLVTQAGSGGPASIEEIVLWLFQRAGRAARLVTGQRTQAYVEKVTDPAGNVFYVGPYNVPKLGAQQVYRRALWDAGLWVASARDGVAEILAAPRGAGGADSAAGSFGYGASDMPVVAVHPAPTAHPAAFTAVNESGIGDPMETTAATDGKGSTRVGNFSNFSAATNAQFIDRAMRQGEVFGMEGSEIVIEVLQGHGIHAGDLVSVALNAHGVVATGGYLCVRASHPLGPQRGTGTLTCQKLALT